ncbi:Putative homoserine kinase type II (protein kinase fold) [Anaerocolumna jejuensis DSM 15929]|uniref:Putative homoserine kinase type II (Protein kinase fold) n=1 Tax=Anaerocolumna jejuensis DSM 15929 TaxID=1121322 RepID=A0A1M6M3C3_9FIRM|nr:Putative homoserine kinase type II (protein kinase fold) [Anaerocolumna jejuensis DSM 15929]
MKYINGQEVLPEDLLKEIRKYAEGVYVYIPKSDWKKNKWGEKTNYHREMELRNRHIYDKYLEGVEIAAISECYHLSANSVRRIILSQKRKMEPVIIMMKELIKEWNLEGEPVQIYHSAWNINNTYVLKEYDDPNALQRNLMMMRTLYEAGIPVPKIIQLPDQQDYLERNNKLYVLTAKLKGRNIVKLQECDSRWFFEFGILLAKLHIAFQECEKKISFWNNSMLEEMNGWVNRDLHKFNPDYLKQDDIKASIDELAQIYDELPKQLIHRDVHLGNFLFDNGVFSGYIDFDLSQRNIRIFDLCYFLLGILLEEDNNRVEKQKWYEIIRQVIGGYDSIAALSTLEKKAVTCVMKNIEILFTAYFLGIGDEKLAKDSADIYTFVKLNEEKIQKAVLV